MSQINLIISEPDNIFESGYKAKKGWLNFDLLQLFLMHPFVVLKRQCQVNNITQKVHILPFSLFPVILKLSKTQGIMCLWKGFSSVISVKLISYSLESFLTWSMEFSKKNKITWKGYYGKNILIKCVTISVMIPWNAVSLAESVQSCVVRERNDGIFDTFKEGLWHFIQLYSPKRGKMLISIYILLPPTIICYLLKQTISEFIYSLVSCLLKFKELWKQQRKYCIEEEKNFYLYKINKIEKTSKLIGFYTAEMLMYPTETIMHRYVMPFGYLFTSGNRPLH
uniref:Solute carrier family 25 member 46 n=1 Tax=Clastoptera arizonana TaxID=38151 RepID=A0A1B6DPM2_9HEMI